MNSQQRFYLKELIKRIEITKGIVETISNEVKGVQNDEGDKFEHQQAEKFKEAAEYLGQAAVKGEEATKALQDFIDNLEKALA